MSSASGSSSRKARGRDDGSPPASKDSRADALEGEEPKAMLWRMPKKLKLPTCHQDHQPKDPKLVAMLRCTHVKQVYNSTKMKQCVNWYCGGCLDRRYGVDAEQIVQSDALKTWKCPVCIGSCNCSKCMSKSEAASSKGDDDQEVGPSVTKPKKRGRPSNAEKAERAATRIPLARSSTRERKPSAAAAAAGHYSSSLSSLSDGYDDSDDEEEEKPAPKRGRPPGPARGPYGPRARPAPRHIPAPLTHTLLPAPTDAFLHRLNVREFLLRFREFTPSLSTRLGKLVLDRIGDGLLFDTASSNRHGFWGIEKEEDQRKCVWALLDLITDNGEEVAWISVPSSRIAVQAKGQCSASAAGKDLKDKRHYWRLCRQFLELEGALAVKPPEEVEEIEGTDSLWEVDEEERLAVMGGLCEIAARCACVRKEMVDGGNEEAALKTELNKNKFRLRNEWTALKVTMNASRPPPLPHGAEDFELHEAWVEASAAVDANIKTETERYEHQQVEIQHASYHVALIRRVRFEAVGRDPMGNSYYLLRNNNSSTFPLSHVQSGSAPVAPLVVPGVEVVEEEEDPYAEIDQLDDDDYDDLVPVSLEPTPYPPGWCVLIHGTPFHTLPLRPTASTPAQPASPPEWFFVSDPKEVDNLVLYLNYQGRLAEWLGEGERNRVEGVEGLGAELRRFGDWLAIEKEKALAPPVV